MSQERDFKNFLTDKVNLNLGSLPFVASPHASSESGGSSSSSRPVIPRRPMV